MIAELTMPNGPPTVRINTAADLADDRACSFCEKPQRDLKMLVAKDDVAICDECVETCIGLMLRQGLMLRVKTMEKP